MITLQILQNNSQFPNFSNFHPINHFAVPMLFFLFLPKCIDVENQNGRVCDTNDLANDANGSNVVLKLMANVRCSHGTSLKETRFFARKAH